MTQNGFFLNRPWWLWGSFFYAAAAALSLGLPKNRLTAVFLAAGALFHAGLTASGYAKTGSVCPVCLEFAEVSSLLAVLYFALPERAMTKAREFAAAVSLLLAAGAAAVLAVAPAAAEHGGFRESPAVLQDRAENPVEKSDAVRELPESCETKDGSNRVRFEKEKPVPEKVSCRIKVYAPDGEEVWLDLKERPALFFAFWCSPCSNVLSRAANLPPEKRPFLVAAYFQEGNAEKVREKLLECGLGSERWYYVKDPPARGVPALLYQEKGAAETAVGDKKVLEILMRK